MLYKRESKYHRMFSFALREWVRHVGVLSGFITPALGFI